MRLLLDTQTALWVIGVPGRFGPRAAVIEPSNTVTTSVCVLWEIVIKRAVGKLRVDLDPRPQLAKRGVDVLPIEAEHALAVADLPLHHRDPFDRMLVAQARHEGMTLVTSDRKLEAYSVAVLRADE